MALRFGRHLPTVARRYMQQARIPARSMVNYPAVGEVVFSENNNEYTALLNGFGMNSILNATWRPHPADVVAYNAMFGIVALVDEHVGPGVKDLMMKYTALILWGRWSFHAGFYERYPSYHHGQMLCHGKFTNITTRQLECTHAMTSVLTNKLLFDSTTSCYFRGFKDPNEALPDIVLANQEISQVDGEKHRDVEPRMPPPDAHSFQIKLWNSDVDLYMHMNHSRIIKIAFDVGSQLANEKKLRALKKDLVLYRIKDLAYACRKEVSAADVVDVHLWENIDDPFQLHCTILKKGELAGYVELTLHEPKSKKK